MLPIAGSFSNQPDQQFVYGKACSDVCANNSTLQWLLVCNQLAVSFAPEAMDDV
jgi:hypothetical protein